jgi:putative multiple sugar transport system substrate-binding protein
MTKLKSLAWTIVAGTLALGASAPAFAQDKGTIGIAMPEQTTLRWNSDGAELNSALEAKGYTVDLQYAGDDIPNQLAQIENMITKGSKALIIAALDGTTLSAALEQAGASDIKVIAYDRLIRDTENVDYYTTFDNFQVGVLQANSILKGLGYPENKGPFNIELFGFARRQQRVLLL